MINLFQTYKNDIEYYKSKCARQEIINNKNIDALNDQMLLTESLTRLLAEERMKNEELTKMLEDPDSYIDQLKRERNRAYNSGRQDAYREMGIRNIEAHERNNCLAILENGDIVELITGLEDVYVEPIKTTETLPDEIKIDDLV